MNSFRIISQNSADTATVTSDKTTPSGMGPSNLKTDIKGEVCRILDSTCTLTFTWPANVSVGACIIPASNLGPSSTIRVKAYADTGGTILLQDTGEKFAAPGGVLGLWDWSQDLNVNAFAFGTVPIVACYLPSQVAARRVDVILNDPANTFIDLSRIIIGAYHPIKYLPSYGVETATVDMSRNSRTASGDIRTDLNPRYSTLSIDISWIAPEDRERFRQLIASGVGRSFFVSLFAENEDPVLERDFSIYGKFSQSNSITFSKFNLYSSQFQIESF